MNHKSQINITPLTLREMAQSAESVYASKNVRGFSWTMLGRVMEVTKKGIVVVRGRWVDPDWAAHRADEDDVWVRVRPSKCFLWGKWHDDPHPCCHWFTNTTEGAR